MVASSGPSRRGWHRRLLLGLLLAGLLGFGLVADDYLLDVAVLVGIYSILGLGLSIVELIARGHGGTVKVASAPGQGSTFTIRVPIARRTTGA